MESNKPAYCFFDVKIHDSEKLIPYQQKVEASYKAFGGRVVIRGGEYEVVEGAAPQGVVVMLEFDSMQKAKDWHESPAYQALIEYRKAGADSNVWLIEGLEK